MKILAFSDWRVQSKDWILKMIRVESPDCIIYAGDDLDRVVPLSKEFYIKEDKGFTLIDNSKDLISKFTRFEGNNDELFQLINDEKVPFYYVNGNDDIFVKKNKKDSYLKVFSTSSVDDNSTRKDIYKKALIPPILGSVTTEGGCLLHGIKCKSGMHSESLTYLPKSYVDILITHIPPYGCLDLSIRFGTDHIGSKKIRKYIEDHEPEYVICGHSHIWGGKQAKIGKTTVINISSHDRIGSEGNYAIIDTDKGIVELKKFKFKNLKSIRGSSMFFQQDIDSRIYTTCKNSFSKIETVGMSKSEIEWVKKCRNPRKTTEALRTRYNLLENDNTEIINSLKENGRELIARRIESLDWERPQIVKKFTLNPDNVLMLDIETGIINPNIWCKNPYYKIWLIGVMYKGKVLQFEMPTLRKDFKEFIKRNEIREIGTWTKFDSKHLSSFKELKDIKWIDLCRRTAASVIWHNYSLHDLYNTIFDCTDEDIISGVEAGIYADHIIRGRKKCKYCPSKDFIKAEIKKRNQADVQQMYDLCRLLYKNKTLPNILYST